MYYIGIIWYLKEGVLIILNEQYIKFFLDQAKELARKGVATPNGSKTLIRNFSPA